MLGNKRRDTKPELAIRRRLHRLGYRFRVDYAPEAAVRARADIVFTRRRVVIFVDGCFWHMCPAHTTLPKANADYWVPKLRANAIRDRRVDTLLATAGWRVLRFWEHESPEEVVAAIAEALASETRVKQGPTSPS
jgi:DNA mismatch endonuclease (patch repair protein)